MAHTNESKWIERFEANNEVMFSVSRVSGFSMNFFKTKKNNAQKRNKKNHMDDGWLLFQWTMVGMHVVCQSIHETFQKLHNGLENTRNNTHSAEKKK